MSKDSDVTTACAAVVERLVETGGRLAGQPGGHSGDPAGDPTIEEHVRSCMSCFRAMSELRDVPRVTEALRVLAPAIPASDDRFWETLARRTTDAMAVALDGPAAVAQMPPRHAPAPARRRWSGLRARVVSVGALAVAAAASWLVVVHRPAAPQGPAAPAVAGLASDEGGSESFSDVADLDAGALHRLLDRLGHHAPPALAGGAPDGVDDGTVNGTDGADVPVDDDDRINDEVAELDGEALRRVATSLERVAL